MTNIRPIEALGDPTRRRIFERLREGACSVNELVEVVSVSQPAVSQHLKVLKEAQLVWMEKQGQQRIYHLDPTGLAKLRQYVEMLWEDVLSAFGDEAAILAASTDNAQGASEKHSDRHSGEAKNKKP
jgi:DNA-binding transcriptional ArsR family regulator